MEFEDNKIVFKSGYKLGSHEVIIKNNYIYYVDTKFGIKEDYFLSRGSYKRHTLMLLLIKPEMFVFDIKIVYDLFKSLETISDEKEFIKYTCEIRNISQFHKSYSEKIIKYIIQYGTNKNHNNKLWNLINSFHNTSLHMFRNLYDYFYICMIMDNLDFEIISNYLNFILPKNTNYVLERFLMHTLLDAGIIINFNLFNIKDLEKFISIINLLDHNTELCIKFFNTLLNSDQIDQFDKILNNLSLEEKTYEFMLNQFFGNRTFQIFN